MQKGKWKYCPQCKSSHFFTESEGGVLVCPNCHFQQKLIEKPSDKWTKLTGENKRIHHWEDFVE